MKLKSFDEVWALVLRRNPKIQSGRVCMSAENFKKAMRFAYEKGSDAGGPIDGVFESLLREWRR